MEVKECKPMSAEELVQLTYDIAKVPGKKLCQVIQIIHSEEQLPKHSVPDEFEILKSLLHQNSSGEWIG